MYRTRWAIGLNAFTHVTAADAVRHAAEAGFTGVEVLADVPHVWPLDDDPGPIRDVERALAETGARVVNVNANTVAGFHGASAREPAFEPSLASLDARERRERIAYTKAAIDLAARFGAPGVSVTAGRPRVPLDDALDTLHASLRDVAAFAEERGVRVGIEYEPGLLVENARELTAVLDRVDSPWLGANLDVTHAWVNGEDLDAVTRTLGPRIVHVHLADAPGRKHLHLVPGDGDVPFPRVLRALAAARYEGALTVEIYPYAGPDAGEAARRAFAYLTRLDEKED